MVPIDVWCGSNPPVKRNGTRKPLTDNRESVHDPGIDRAIGGVAPKNVLPAGPGEVAEANDLPVERRKTETQIFDNHISAAAKLAPHRCFGFAKSTPETRFLEGQRSRRGSSLEVRSRAIR